MQKVRTPAMAALAVAVMSALQAAHGQQAVEKGERIEVTGSRLTSSDVESASPIVVVRPEDIKIEGFQQLELILANYPQIQGDQGNRINNGATGGATISLRGLGAQRTLTLLNGKRMPPGSPFYLAPDVDQIPPALIQRIEILTGGASAVYGSDAIAGVVNFIMKDHFEGVEGDVSYDFYNHHQHNGFMQDLLRQRNYPIPGDKSSDGATTATNLVMGGNFAGDKGNATVAFRYVKTEALLQSERDYSACALGGSRSKPACGGAVAGNPGRFTDLNADPFPFSWTMDSSGNVRPFVRPADLYNFAPLNYFQRPQERYGFNAFVNYDMSPSARLYTEFGYTDDNTRAQLAPTAVFFVPADVRWENPQLTDEWRRHLVFLNPDGSIGTGPGTVAQIAFDRRNVEGGGRVQETRQVAFREVLGLKGTVARDWDYDVYFQDSRVTYSGSFNHEFSVTRLSRALDVVVDPSTGRAACASALNGTDPRCVPYNLWIPNGVTPEALAYLQIPALDKSSISQRIFGATVTTDLGRYGLRSPRANGGVEVALGFEQRTEKLDYEPDSTYMSGDAVSSSSPIEPVRGKTQIKDLFGEIRIPVADALNVNGSYRHSDYGSKTTDTYGVGFNAAPSSRFRMRGSYQKAVRAPDINELFTPQVLGGAVYFDPCAGAEPEATLAECRRTGVTATQYGNISPTPFNNNAIVGGNPNLSPETANTYTLGIVLTPSRDLSITVDYYDMRIANTIAWVDPDYTIGQCLSTGDPRFCSLIVRDPVQGTLWLPGSYVDVTNQNIGNVRTSGIDVALNYKLKLPKGHSLLFDGSGSYLAKLSVEPFAGGSPVECAGWFLDVCGIPNPRWRHRLRTTWATSWNVDAALTWRYMGSSKNIQLTYPAEIGAVSYIDLAGTWNVNKYLTVRGGVNNVFDKDPPLSVQNTNGNTFAQNYDVLGRHFFMSLTAKF
jgi:iron complex outermembrane receptor protein